MFDDKLQHVNMDTSKIELKNRLKVYRDLDNQLREVNKTVYDLREKRKIVEYEMIDILKDPQFSNVGVLRLENDNSTIRIQRPGTYSKAWSMSKRDLQNFIDHYFETAKENANRQDCFEFIVQQQKIHALETDYKITRTIPNENLENE